MISLLFIFHLLILIYAFNWVRVEKSRVYQYPFLATLVWFSFILPQFLGLINSNEVGKLALIKTLFFSLLCLIGLYIGYFRGFRVRLKNNNQYFSLKRIWFSGILLFLIGSIGFFIINRFPEEAKSSQWSGLVVAIYFFASNLKYALAISLMLFLSSIRMNRFYKLTLFMVLVFSLLLYLDRIVFLGRRGDALEVFFIITLSFFFMRNLVLKRNALILVALLGMIGLFSTWQYRSLMQESNSLAATLNNINFADNFETISEEGGEEVKNAVMMIDSVDDSFIFDFGAFNWNILIFNYVPAQLVGSDFKESLQINTVDPISIVHSRYEKAIGATKTGLSDSFYSFWYFGWIKFFIIGYLMAIIYRKAVSNNFMWQLFYMLILTSSLHAITHHTQWFFSPWVHIFIFLYPLLKFSETKKYVALSNQ